MLELPTLLSRVHEALAALGQTGAPAEPEAKKLTPGQVRKSITPDALISFIDGKPYKTLKRHLTGHGLTIEAYRERFGLPHDYPTTAANYSAMRAEFARTAGLGHKRRKPAQTAAAEPADSRRGAGQARPEARLEPLTKLPPHRRVRREGSREPGAL